MAIAIYEDLAGRRYWAESTSKHTIRQLALGDWLLYDDTPSTAPPATDPLGAEMAERVPGTGPFAAALRAALVAKVHPATGVAATDTAAIQAALAAAEGAGRRCEVVLGGGEYIVNATIALPLLMSLDMAGSTIKAANGSNLPAVLETKGWSALTGTGSSAGMTGNALRNGIIDGNKANNPSGGVAARLYGWAYAVTDMFFQNGKTGGLTTEWGVDVTPVVSPPQPAVSMEAIYKNVRCLSSDGHGWVHSGPHDSIFVGISCAFNTGDGWRDHGGPGGSNGAGSHVLNANNYSNGGRAFSTNSGGMVGQDVAVSGPAPSLLIGDDSGPCLFTGLTAQSVDIRSQYHRVSGRVINGYEDVSAWGGHGVRLAGNAYGVVLDLIITNCRNGIYFEDDAPGSFIKALIVPYDETSTAITGTPNATASLMLRYEGAGPDAPGGSWYTPDIIKSGAYLQTSGNVNAAHATADQVTMGFAGPAGQPGVDFHTDGLTKLYRSGAGVLRASSWVLVEGNLGAGVDASGGFDAGHLLIGPYHLWIDGGGLLRIKNGAPTSSTDGTVVGTQT